MATLAGRTEYPPGSGTARVRQWGGSQYDKVNHDLRLVTLQRDIPALIKRLGLGA